MGQYGLFVASTIIASYACTWFNVYPSPQGLDNPKSQELFNLDQDVSTPQTDSLAQLMMVVNPKQYSFVYDLLAIPLEQKDGIPIYVLFYKSPSVNKSNMRRIFLAHYSSVCQCQQRMQTKWHWAKIKEPSLIELSLYQY